MLVEHEGVEDDQRGLVVAGAEAPAKHSGSTEIEGIAEKQVNDLPGSKMMPFMSAVCSLKPTGHFRFFSSAATPSNISPETMLPSGNTLSVILT